MYQKQGKRKWGSFPIVNVIFSTLLALFVMGLFGLLIIHANELTQRVQENISLQVYLNKKVTENDIIKLEQAFGKESFVLRKDGVPRIDFISKKEAAEVFVRETGENFIEILQENPLRDSFIVYIDPTYQSAEMLQTIKKQLNKLNGVFEVCYVENLVPAINKNVRYASIVLLFFAFLLLFAVVVLINNTIKLALYSQRFLIHSMNLVGATAAFIRSPFLLRATLVGLLAGMMADIFLLALLHYANLQMDVLVGLQRPIKVLVLLGILPLLGMAVTLMSTYRAVNKYLYLPLEDLH
jgi:cell division transport system permease protein